MDVSTEIHQPPEKRVRSRWRRRILIAIVFVFLVCLLLPTAWYAFNVLADKRAIAEAIAEADRLDPGWRWDELEAKRAVIPDAENSALRILAARKALPNPWPTPRPKPPRQQGQLESEETGDPISLEDEIPELLPELLRPEIAKELKTELAKATPALVEARSLANLPSGRYSVTWPINLANVSLPCQEARNIAWLLSLDAVSRAQDNDADAAFESARAILNAGRSIGDEPHFVSQLVRMTLERMAVSSLERALAQGQPSEKALRAAQQLLEDEAAQPLLLFILRGERASSHRMQEAIETGQVKYAEAIGAGTGGWRGPGDFIGTQMTRRCHPFYLRIHTELIEIAKRSGDKQFAQIEKRLREVGKTDLPVWVRLGLPIYERESGAFQRSQAWLRCTVAALATERFRLAKHYWPESLDVVKKSGFLTQVPTDPYDVGAPLRFRHLSDGLVIYSIGPDGKDHGGKILRSSSDKENANWGFQLWDIGRRRQPPQSQAESSNPAKN
jgi:hypothetical protein